MIPAVRMTSLTGRNSAGEERGLRLTLLLFADKPLAQGEILI